MFNERIFLLGEPFKFIFRQRPLLKKLSSLLEDAA
jgi:hypothetical protein